MAVTDILPGAVDLIHVDRCGVEAVTEPVSFHRLGQGHPFIEVVPGYFFQVSEAIYDTNGQLGSELDIGSRLAPYDRPNMGLANADYTVLHAVSFVIKHVLLLTVKFYDGL